MERPSGKFNRLAKPAFDRDNPNAVLGEVRVPGLEQVRVGGGRGSRTADARCCCARLCFQVKV